MFETAVETAARLAASGLEFLGIGVIAGVALFATGAAALHLIRGSPDTRDLTRTFRHRLAHGILLGLEFLVAADIIRTVAVDFTFRNVGVLAIIVAIRTFLSFTLEVEINGRWPWQEAPKAEGTS